MSSASLDVRADSGRLERQQVSQHSQDVAPSFHGRNKQLHPVGEEQQSNFVVVGRCGNGHDRGQLDRKLSLEPVPGAEISGSAHVDREHHRQLPLLDVALDVRLSRAGGDVPVNGPHVVARYVLADLIELHAPALEHRVVLTRQPFLDKLASRDLDSPDPGN